MTGVLVMGRSVVATRRRAAAKIRVLSPDVVPMSKEDEQQAIHAISASCPRLNITPIEAMHLAEAQAPRLATLSVRPHLEAAASRQFKPATSGLAFLQAPADPIELSPVFLDGAEADTPDSKQVRSRCGARLSDGSQCLVVEDAERRNTPPPRFVQSPGAQSLLRA